jgi:hypothetical protein
METFLLKSVFTNLESQMKISKFSRLTRPVTPSRGGEKSQSENSHLCQSYVKII